MNDLKALQEAMAGLGAAMERVGKTFKRFGAVNGRTKSGKTRRGAKHTLGSVFLGRKIFNGTPAEYRRAHKGRLIQVVDGKKVKFVPNYKKPSAAPRARNVWTSN